ncbi:PREDICTED: uncharacterized protein KIAA1211 homolog isoform X2 [Dinoponera quadriceps]|uniref:Uncharacterized protein KIAA1211 homolog isoform X2 n=1 Tax=Dinoponera quadriceps TaxID=609295 RepID=A0A6P3X796_DINQU|nr:PREDICTED: uncharacterized protein KIAA1211 homolog isoform X2 [Dinoponera quadriceps]
MSCRKDCSKSQSREDIVAEKATIYHQAAKSELRYVNSAIYTETVSEEERDAAKSEIRSENDREDRTREDERSERGATGQDTYRCYSLPDATRLSLEPSAARAERRCKIDGGERPCQAASSKRERCSRQVARTSLLSSEPIGDDRRIAHSEWVRRKHEAARRKREDEERATKKRQEEEEEMVRTKEERVRLEKENFLKWMEGKRRQELDRRAMFQNELELQKCLKEIEDKTAVAKALYLRQWIRKKKEEQKAQYKEQESRQRKINEEREKRLEQCSTAYEKWKRNSKNRPKPATQGLLPHQKAKPAYVNPIPWQPIVEIDSDEAQQDALNDENRDKSQLNGGRTVMAHQ